MEEWSKFHPEHYQDIVNGYNNNKNELISILFSKRKVSEKVYYKFKFMHKVLVLKNC